ncbi:MAG: formylglycine-generating enzyme family protein [Planctomycetes bacterium]|nr:formylglycine-generating enzyme family protein [Planctomycetota bacterium]
MPVLHRLALVAITAMLLVSTAKAGETVGLVKEKPTKGRFVETDRGFMVPYTRQIPGTDVEFSMEPIPGGTFKLGSPVSEADRRDDEGPQIEVSIEPYWMGRYEVTWSEYKYFMGLYSVFKDFESQKIRLVNDKTMVDAITAPTELYDPSFTFELGERPRQPAVTMTQYAAKQYTKWLSAITGNQFRLPGEAEWEHACRAGTTTAYHFGDDASKIGEYGWFYDNADEAPRDVGQKKPNPWGLFDMHGNVWEWCLDEYFEDGYAHLAGKHQTGQNAIAWPTKEFPRVLRGGSWDDDPEACRSAAKLASHDIDWKAQDPNLPLSPYWFTDDPARGVGFRLLRPLNELPKTEMAKYWEPDAEDISFGVEIRLDEGRGVLGIVDDKLPAARKALEDSK